MKLQKPPYLLIFGAAGCIAWYALGIIIRKENPIYETLITASIVTFLFATFHEMKKEKLEHATFIGKKEHKKQYQDLISLFPQLLFINPGNITPSEISLKTTTLRGEIEIKISNSQKSAIVFEEKNSSQIEWSWGSGNTPEIIKKLCNIICEFSSDIDKCTSNSITLKDVNDHINSDLVVKYTINKNRSVYTIPYSQIRKIKEENISWDQYEKSFENKIATPQDVIEACNLLSLNENCSHKDLKSSYRKMTRIHHPDFNGGSKQSEQMMSNINSAKDTIEAWINNRG